MKRLLSFFVLTVLVGSMCSVSAQDYKKNIFGIRVGMNVANANMKISAMDLIKMDLDTKSRVSYNVGLSYERLLLSNSPLYLETGLYYTDKGFKGIDTLEDIKCSTGYLQLPLMVNYKFNILNLVTIAPSAGIYYSLGVADMVKFDGLSESNVVFGEDGIFKRSDFGYRLGVSVSLWNFVLGFSYEGGFINTFKSDNLDMGFDDAEYYDYDYDDFDIGIDAKAHTSNFVISLGYNF